MSIWLAKVLGPWNIDEFGHHQNVLEPPVQFRDVWSSGTKQDGQDIEALDHDYRYPDGMIWKLQEKVASRPLSALEIGATMGLTRVAKNTEVWKLEVDEIGIYL